jgi:hypothetical protein
LVVAAKEEHIDGGSYVDLLVAIATREEDGK